MTFKKWSLAAAALTLIAPLSASALGIVIDSVTSSGASTTVVSPGDTITFNLLLENATQETVFGLGIVADGYDAGAQGFASDNRLVFIGGESAASILEPVPGFGGLGNQLGTTAVQLGGVAPPPSPPNPTTLQALLFNGANPSSTANGLGNNEVLNSNGVHFTVTFLARNLGTPGTVNLNFGIDGAANVAVGAGGSSLAFNNAGYSLVVVPEPGTALLMGLGLAGLAGVRRR